VGASHRAERQRRRGAFDILTGCACDKGELRRFALIATLPQLREFSLQKKMKGSKIDRFMKILAASTHRSTSGQLPVYDRNRGDKKC
jgi:hypothetical protein